MQEEMKWQISSIYNINEFDSEGKNIYIDEQDNIYIDYINIKTRELCLDKYDSKTKKKIMTINTGYYANGAKKIYYGSRDELLGFLFQKGNLILVIPGDELILNYYDLINGKLIRKQIIKNRGKNWIFHVYLENGTNIIKSTNGERFDDYPYSSVENEYMQLDVQIEKNKILFNSPYIFDSPFFDFPLTKIFCVTFDAKTIYEGFFEALFGLYDVLLKEIRKFGIEEETIYPNDPDKQGYICMLPIYLNKEGKLVFGFTNEEYKEIERYYKEKNYEIFTEITVDAYITKLAYVEEDGSIWVIYDLTRGKGSSVVHMKKYNGKWKIIDSIGPWNIIELSKITIDRILRVENNKIYLWVRKYVGSKKDENGEKIYIYDREIWVIEKK